MKKQYIIPTAEIQHFCFENLMTTTSDLVGGDEITPGEGTVYGDTGRQFWYDDYSED